MQMKKVVVASLNPAKINAVKTAFLAVFKQENFEFCGVNVASEVADQPMSSDETLQGAKNRVRNAKIAQQADFYVGIEAGLEGDSTFAWMIIESKGVVGLSRSASLMLPPAVVAQLSPTNELGDVMDSTFGTQNIKQQGGAIALLTNGELTRSSVYHQALILALIPFINPDQF